MKRTKVHIGRQAMKANAANRKRAKRKADPIYEEIGVKGPPMRKADPAWIRADLATPGALLIGMTPETARVILRRLATDCPPPSDEPAVVATCAALRSALGEG